MLLLCMPLPHSAPILNHASISVMPCADVPNTAANLVQQCSHFKPRLHQRDALCRRSQHSC